MTLTFDVQAHNGGGIGLREWALDLLATDGQAASSDANFSDCAQTQVTFFDLPVPFPLHQM